MNRLGQSKLFLVLGVFLAAFLLLAPYLIPLFLNTFWVNILTEILIWSLFAASVNLLFGYTGLLSFGQALFFGMGAYGVAFGLSVFGLSFWPSFFLGVAAATVTAAVTGIFAVRLTWSYFTILTVVFSLIFYLFAVGRKDITNGDDGMAFQVPPVFEFGGWKPSMLDITFQYYFVLLIVAALYLFLWFLMRSPLGYAFMAVRENDRRASLIGLSPYRVRYYSFVLAGILAGVAGVLFALFSRYTTAQYMFWTVSGDGVVWVVVGGAGTLLGPALGTALLIVLREELSVHWEHFLILVGIIVIVTITFEPAGLMGILNRWNERRSTSKESAETQLGDTKSEVARL
jgi:branched-chain amino acid transport system permease protein